MNFTDKVTSIKPKADFFALTYISLRNRYVYLAVGKAANSTVKHHLYELEYSGTRFKSKSVHDRQSAPLLSPFQLPDDLLEEVFTGPDYFRFAVVRSPYSRLLSCYLDRIVPARGGAYTQLIRALGYPDGTAVSFPEFIRTACSQTPFVQNLHWRLQVAEICLDVIPYAFIGRQETFSDDMSKIWSRIAPDHPMREFARSNKSPSVTGAKDRLNEYYTPELIALVRSAYGPDFERFGYPLELA
jgi:Sulfotransferase family